METFKMGSNATEEKKLPTADEQARASAGSTPHLPHGEKQYAGVKYCVVDANGSHRDVWYNHKVVNGVEYVACDFHTEEEFNDAIRVAEKKRQQGGTGAVAEGAKEPAARVGTQVQTAQAQGKPAPTGAPIVPEKERLSQSGAPTPISQGNKSVIETKTEAKTEETKKPA